MTCVLTPGFLSVNNTCESVWRTSGSPGSKPCNPNRGKTSYTPCPEKNKCQDNKIMKWPAEKHCRAGEIAESYHQLDHAAHEYFLAARKFAREGKRARAAM